MRHKLHGRARAITPRRPELFTEHDAAFRLERVYFRSPRAAGQLEPGDLLFFYVSGRVGQVLGVARCTASEVLDDQEAVERYGRLAVLDPSAVGNLVHCIAFDNYLPFKNPVGLSWMKKMGLAATQNFITIAQVPEPPGASYRDLITVGLDRG